MILKRLWRTLRHDPGAVDHEHPVGPSDQLKSVRDENRRAISHGRFVPLDDLFLSDGIERSRRFVQNQYGGIGQQGSGHCDALALADRDRQPTISDRRCEAFREPRDEL